MLPIRLQAARVRLEKDHWYLHDAIFRVVFVEKPGLGSLAADMWWRIYYDPEIIEDWSVEELAGVLYHELIHLLDDHATRLKNIDPVLANYGADAAVNDWLVEKENIPLPGDPITPKKYGFPSGKTAEEYVEMFRNLFPPSPSPSASPGTESGDDADTRNDRDGAAGGTDRTGTGGNSGEDDDAGKKPGGDEGDGDAGGTGSQGSEADGGDDGAGGRGEHEEARESGSGGSGDDAGGDDKGSGGSGDDAGGDDKGSGGAGKSRSESAGSPGTGRDGEDGSAGGDAGNAGAGGNAGEDKGTGRSAQSGNTNEGGTGNAGGGKNEKAKPAPGAGRCGSCATGRPEPWEDPPPDQGGPEGVTQIQAELIRRMVAVQIREAAKTRGDVPAGWKRWAEEILRPKVDWRKELAAAIRSALSTVSGAVDYTRSVPSRRQAAYGRVLMPALRRPEPNVAVVVDTSGSMSDREMGRAIAEVGGILQAAGLREGVRVLAVDAKVHAARRVFRPNQIELIGGGGTDMTRGIEAAERLRPRPDVIVVITDGYTPWPDTPPKARVIVALTDPDTQESVPEWAKIVVVEP